MLIRKISPAETSFNGRIIKTKSFSQDKQLRDLVEASLDHPINGMSVLDRIKSKNFNVKLQSFNNSGNKCSGFATSKISNPNELIVSDVYTTNDSKEVVAEKINRHITNTEKELGSKKQSVMDKIISVFETIFEM
jgi:hypothetical protein